MKKRFCFFTLAFMLFFLLLPSAVEYDVISELSPYLPDGAGADISQLADNISNGKITEQVLSAVSDALPDVAGAFGSLLCAVILSGVSGAVSSSLQADEDVCSIAGVAVCAVLVFSVIKTSFDALHTALTASVSFMTALLGVMCYVYGMTGNLGGAGVSYSILSAVLHVLELICSYALFPLCVSVFGMTLADSFKQNGELSGVAQFVKRTAVFLLSACGGAVTLALSISGAFASVSNGILKKSVKFASGAFIPIIGSSLSEAYDAVFSSINVIKATAGGGGIAALLLIFAPALVSLCVTKLMLSTAGLISRSFGLERQAKLICGCGEILTVMIGICTFACVVMIIACAVFMKVTVT